VSIVGCLAGGFIVMIGATSTVPRSLLGSVNPPMHLSKPLKQFLDGAQYQQQRRLRPWNIWNCGADDASMQIVSMNSG
jgi:hypothetical protein